MSPNTPVLTWSLSRVPHKKTWPSRRHHRVRSPALSTGRASPYQSTFACQGLTACNINPLSCTYYVPGMVPMLTCHTLFDCHTNPTGLGWYSHLTSEKARQKDVRQFHVQPLTWGAALRDVKLGLSKVKACLRPLVLYSVTHPTGTNMASLYHGHNFCLTGLLPLLFFFFKLMS